MVKSKRASTGTKFAGVSKMKNYQSLGHQYRASVYYEGKTHAIFASTALECARRLNNKREKLGLPLTNPNVGSKITLSRRGVIKDARATKFVGVRKLKSKEAFRGHVWHGEKFVAVQADSAIECARRLNGKCQQLGLPLRNPKISVKIVADDTATEYVNVRYSDSNGTFVGCASENGVRLAVYDNCALRCAKKLNKKCKENGLRLRNPSVGVRF